LIFLIFSSLPSINWYPKSNENNGAHLMLQYNLSF